MDREKAIKELHDARQYLEDKEWSDRCASPHIDAINNALAMLKEQEHKDKMFHALEEDWKRLNELLKEQNAVKVQYTAMGGLRYGACPQCGARIENLVNPKACGFCGQAVKWE